MKLNDFIRKSACMGIIALSMATLSCTSENAPIPQANPEGIANQVKQAISNEVELMELSDTISFHSNTDSATVDKRQRPIVINHLKILVENDDYSTALDMYNQRLRDGRNFAVKMLTIILPFSFLIIIVAGILWYLLRKTRERNRLIEEAIKNGYQLPDSFYENSGILNFRQPNTTNPDSTSGSIPPPTNRDQRLFQSGLTWFLVGLASFLCLIIWGGIEAAAICLIPTFIGIGKLVTYYR